MTGSSTEDATVTGPRYVRRRSILAERFPRSRLRLDDLETIRAMPHVPEMCLAWLPCCLARDDVAARSLRQILKIGTRGDIRYV
ncbi:hypothetical protein JL39_10465 [Rhizobium sp. YS-1r]|nr:hypothetical protein JL39_10465 [Rhizobium sp. YS-1r]